jgi:hypothetical protein
MDTGLSLGAVSRAKGMSTTLKSWHLTASMSSGVAAPDARMTRAASLIADLESVTMVEPLCSTEYLPGEASVRRM